jgi:hypothetical protein
MEFDATGKGRYTGSGSRSKAVHDEINDLSAKGMELYRKIQAEEKGAASQMKLALWKAEMDAIKKRMAELKGEK